MRDLEQSTVRLIEALTDGKLRATSFDLEIEGDNLKYSGWLSALGTAGIAMVITNFEKVTPTFSISYVPVALVPVLSGVFLATSVAIGCIVNWSVNRDFSRKRQAMTLFIGQKCRLYSGDANIEPGDDISEKILSNEYLSKGHRDHLEKLDAESGKRTPEERFLLAQGTILLLGFIIAFLGAIRI